MHLDRNDVRFDWRAQHAENSRMHGPAKPRAACCARSLRTDILRIVSALRGVVCSETSGISIMLFKSGSTKPKSLLLSALWPSEPSQRFPHLTVLCETEMEIPAPGSLILPSAAGGRNQFEGFGCRTRSAFS